MQKYFFLLCCLIPSVLFSQMEKAVSNKVFKETLINHAITTGQTLHLNFTNAMISYDTWDKQEVEISLTRIGQNTNKEQAEKDLNNLKFEFGEVRNAFKMRGYIALDKYASNSSKLGFIVKIKAPKKSSLNIIANNSKMVVNNLDGDCKIQESNLFVIKFEKTNSNIECTGNEVKLVVNNSNYSLKANVQKSGIELNSSPKTSSLNLVLSDLKVKNLKNLDKMQITGQNSDIDIETDDAIKIHYNINLNRGKLEMPKDINDLRLNKDNTVYVSTNTANSCISIQLLNSNVKIQ
jgi:hypothetical protein